MEEPNEESSRHAEEDTKTHQARHSAVHGLGNAVLDYMMKAAKSESAFSNEHVSKLLTRQENQYSIASTSTAYNEALAAVRTS